MNPTATISRRKAVQLSSLGLGAALVHPFSVSSKPEIQKKLGVALVGLGRYSNFQLGPALQHTELCELKGIVTGTPSKRETWAKEYGIEARNMYSYEEFDRIKDNEEIDIVYVVLPNAMHKEFTLRAAEAGKHVICEKPMGISAQECLDMMEGCKQAGVKLSVGYRLYFEPHHLEVRRMGVEKVHGKVQMMEAGLGFSMADPTSWRLNKDLGGGGALIDLGLYAIQGCRRVVGEEPTRVTAQGLVHRPEIFKGIWEHMSWQMEFPSGAFSNSTTSYSAYVDRMYATAERGWFQLSPSFNATGATGLTHEGPLSFTTPPYQQIAQIDHFAQCVLEDQEPMNSGYEGWKDLKIIEAIFEAAETGEAVEIGW
ncbi:MAG: Gfo/Idh/MocA family oxidoreductase [Bacteroidota bacterium]